MGMFGKINKWYKQLEKSTGLEAIQMVVHNGFIHFALNFKGTGVSHAMVTGYYCIADGFYYKLAEELRSAGIADPYDELADYLKSDLDNGKVFAARVCGIVLGVALVKAANMSDLKVNEEAMMSYVLSQEFDYEYQKQVNKMAIAYVYSGLDKMPGSIAIAESAELAAMAHYLTSVDAEGRYSVDYATCKSMLIALMLAYKEIVITPTFIEDAKKAGMLV